jgi:DNA-binding NtrC family response regulator
MVLCSKGLSDGDFRAVITALSQANKHLPVIVFGRSYEWDSYLKALAAGAYDYIVCPPNPVEVERILLLVLADSIGAEKVSGATA